MKKLKTTLYILSTLLLLSGCHGKTFSSRRDMEHLLPVQTMALDRQGEGYVVSISTGPGPEDAPALVMSANGDSIEAALIRLQDFSPGDELFYAHVRYILMGGTMTDGAVLSLLDWVERSPSMRMETPLLLIPGRAAEAVTGASGELGDATERLASLEREERARGRHIYTLRETAASLLERGGALCLTAAPLSADGVIFTEPAPADALVPGGYAVLTGGEGAVLLTEEETLGTQLLAGGVSGAEASLPGAVVSITGSDTELRPLRDGEGTVTGIRVRCRLLAGLMERTGTAPVELAALSRSLETAAEGWLTAAVTRSQALGCDYMGLGAALGQEGPAWAARFPDLTLEVTAEAVLDRSYDLSDG